MTAQPNIRSDILGKLLLIQETLEVLPDNAGIAAFLSRALGEIPGVTDLHLCVGGTVFPPSAEFVEACARHAETHDASGACTGLMVGNARTICTPLRTARNLYGMLILSLDDEEAFSPYRAFVQNIANVIATTCETREYIHQLDEARAGLETQVVERTATLRESQEKFRALVETTSDWVWEVDAGGTYVYASPKVEALLGYKPDEVIGKTPLGLMPPEERQRIAPAFLAARQARKPLEQVINTNLHKDGHAVVMETSGTPIIDSRGNLAGYRGINRDITARRRAEESLRESEEKFRQVSASAQDAVIVLNQDGAITDWNAAAEKIFGYAATEIIGQDLHSLLVPARQRGASEKGIQQFRKSGTGPVINKTLELAALRRDGTEFPVELSISSVQLRGQWHAIGIVRDISERKRAETALQQSKNSMDEAQRIARVGNWELNIASDALTWTDEIYRIFEIDPQKFGASYEAFLGAIHPDDRERVDKVYADSVKNRTPYSIEHRLLMHDGRVKFVQERCETFYSDDGRPLRSIGTLQDITERKQAEAARIQLAAIVQFSNDAIIGKDLDGIISSWNPGAEKVYGYRADEIVGRSVSVLAPDDRKDEMMQLLGAICRGETVVNFETERFRKDGQRIDIALTMSPIKDPGGRITGVSTIARDITEKKQAERALHKVNRALKALSNCNMALIHATEEMQFLNEICRVILDSEGYRLAWVGYVEHDAQKTVRLVAQSGYEPGYMEQALITWADNERGRGPLGIAIRTGRIQVVQDVKTDPQFEPWRENAARLGYGSVLVAPLLADSRVIGALSIHAEGANAFDAGEIALLSELAADMAFGIVTLRTRGAHEHSAMRLQRSMEATIQAMADTVEMRDPYTAGHQRRVAELAMAIARDMGLAEDQVRGVHLAGVVHDLGKIHIPAEILSKPGKLTNIEFELIKTHPEAGYEILKGIDFPWPIAQIVFQHHERLDGSGYPRGLKADEILLEARILTVADVVEAMASHRPYRPALGIERALEEIATNSGKYYDAQVARTCIGLFRDKMFAFTR